MQPIQFSALLRAGGVRHDVGGATRLAVLHDVVARLPLSADVDRGRLLEGLEAREAAGTTGIGEGIAIPHARDVPLGTAAPLVGLALLREPVDFGAADGVPVHAVFLIVSGDSTLQLRILGQLGFLLRDAALRALLRRRAPADETLARIELLESVRNETRTTGQG